MSPLKITLLLNLYSRPQARDAYYWTQEQDAPAMREAFDDFIRLGILKPEATHQAFRSGTLPYAALTARGDKLVERLKAVGIEP